ncbi:cation:proton antiporter [bacterium]|nr:cation:proton antiporter [bacterium]
MVSTILTISIALMLIGSLLGIIRLILGPSIIDRVIAMDVLTIISISLIVVIALIADRFIYVDVAIVYALLSFLGVVAVARCTESQRGLE